ncbi:MAG: type II toxin-antitoxin system ParD family antitoxin [Candidatus Lokiarchaeota archaeon]
MKICTVNLPENYITAMEKLVGDKGLYPSRSELIRCAVRDFLIREISLAQKMIKYNGKVDIDNREELDDSKYVRVPIEGRNKENEPVREFKTYKIINSYNKN